MRQKVITSKLTSKHQATIPASVRDVLDLHAGDSVAFEIISGGSVRLRKATPFDVEFVRALEGTLASEWLSEADEEAYGGL